MVNIKTEHKTTQILRDRVKRYEDHVRQNEPDKHIKRLEYHRNYYQKLKEAHQKMQMLEKNNENNN